MTVMSPREMAGFMGALQGASSPAPEPQTVPCGGCGATSSSERCVGCLHDFGDAASAWVHKYGTTEWPPPAMDEMHAVAWWVVEVLGYPVDFSTGVGQSPPAALRDAIVDVVLADEGRRHHGGTLDREEVEAWLSDEGRWPS